MNSDHVNAIVVQCLEYAAESNLAPASAAADFLRLLTTSSAFSLDEVDEATFKISRVIRGIGSRDPHEAR
jgi:hypothetical protein